MRFALGVHFDNTTPPSQVCSVAAVGNGGAVVMMEGEKTYAVGRAPPRATLVALCSCGGRRGAESVEVRQTLDLFSSCVHARALLASMDQITELVGLPGVLPRLQRFPPLDYSRTARPVERVVYYAPQGRGSRGALPGGVVVAQ